MLTEVKEPFETKYPTWIIAFCPSHQRTERRTKMKQPTPNLEAMLRSAVFALQEEHEKLKNAMIQNIRCSWINNNGDFVVYDGLEERKEKIRALKSEVLRLYHKANELKDEIRTGTEMENEE